MDAELKNNILKTGTTILGIICKNGVVMASDRRATAGNLVLSKNTKKAVKINDSCNVWNRKCIRHRNAEKNNCSTIKTKRIKI